MQELLKVCQPDFEGDFQNTFRSIFYKLMCHAHAMHWKYDQSLSQSMFLPYIVDVMSSKCNQCFRADWQQIVKYVFISIWDEMSEC